MQGPVEIPATWWAKGLLFENCNCQLVCPGHMHFEQLCTHERCIGYWCIRFADGRFGSVSLAGLKAVIAYDTPQNMISGNWTERIIVDAAATPAGRAAVDALLRGRAGGPWARLGAFVGTWLDTQVAAIEFSEDETGKRVRIAGLLESVVTRIRGRDKTKPVLFENSYNQIHSPTQVIATGDSRYDDGVIRFETARTHGLWSNFDWRVEAA